MIGDNPVNDIQGGREKIKAVTLQKIHAGTPVGTGDYAPDAVFNEFKELRELIKVLGSSS
jgi:putative hydrolase of the HAD superfamily